VDLDEILYGGDDIEDDLDLILCHSFNHSKMADVETCDVGAILNRLMDTTNVEVMTLNIVYCKLM
jgi:hypothetical protein